MISGSWDTTGRLWSNWHCSQELKGHSGPLWAVADLPATTPGEVTDEKSIGVLTASADKTINLWVDGKVREINHIEPTQLVLKRCILS